MENLIKESRKLAEKQSHVRESFKNWLKEFAEATSADIQDKELDIIPIGGFETEINQLILLRGSKYLYEISSYHIAHTQSVTCAVFTENVEQEVDIWNCDMQYIRTALKNIPGAIEQHIQDLKDAQQQCDELEELIKT